MDVVRRALAAVLACETVATGVMKRLHELHARDRPPRGVGRDFDERAGHEELRPFHEGLEGGLSVQAIGQGDRLARAGHGPREARRDDPDALADLFVVPAAPAPTVSPARSLQRPPPPFAQPAYLAQTPAPPHD